MRKMTIYFFVVALNFIFVNSNYSQTIKVLHQKSHKREYCDASHSLVYKLNLDSMIFVPSYCEFDDKNNIYVFDYSTFYIHKFSPNKSSHTYSHTYFGKGKGKGPGEFVHPRALKINDSKIYIPDPSNACIAVYSTNGRFVKWITLENHLLPEKLAIIDNQLLVGSQSYTRKKLFYLYDYSGKIVNSFGSYINKNNVNNLIYHDYDILEIAKDKFCYISAYLGLMGLYKNNNLVLIKETIDGIKNPEAINNKELIEGVYVNKIKKKYYTASTSACNGEYLILLAIDVEKRKGYYDIYDVKDFHYIKSIKNLKPMKYFAMNSKLLVGVSSTCLYIWDLNDILGQTRL